MNKKETEAKWEKCLRLIRTSLGNDTVFATWIQPSEARSLIGNRLTLRLPSMFCAELYDKTYNSHITQAIRSVFGPETRVIYEVPVVQDVKEGKVKIDAGKAQQRQPLSHSSSIQEPAIGGYIAGEDKKENEQFTPKLNETLSFENFCVGQSNKLPWTIAESIARQPVNSNFNPFFLYGDVGVGKTHLMQAIGLQVKKNYPDKKVVFLPMKEFQWLYQNAVLKKEIPSFLQWFMSRDVLLFDDLQEIVGSEKTLNNALFPIFSHLQMHGKQLVFTCDRPPHELKELADRLIDRFKWGIVEKLEKPDVALRKKIISFKARKNGLDLPAAVIDYIANLSLNSVREIEGIVLGMMIRAIKLGLEIDMKLAREVVGQATKSPGERSLNFEMIVQAVADEFDLNADVIFTKSRVKDVAEARMAIMYIAQKKLGLSNGSIGRKLGRKHSTVIHGIKVVEQRRAVEPEYADMIDRIQANL